MRKMGAHGLCKLSTCIIIAAILTMFGAACETNNDGSEMKMTELMKEALMLSGRDITNFDESELETSERMIMESVLYLEEKLKEKYPETEFQMIAFIPQGLNQQYDEAHLIPVDRPQNEFVARIYKSKDSFYCTDGYYGILKTAEYEKLLKEKLAALDCTVQVFSTINYQFSEEYGTGVSLTKAIEDTSFFAYSWILLPSEVYDFEEVVRQVEQIVKENALCGDYAVYRLLDDDVSAVSKEDAFNRIPLHTDKQPVYSTLKRFVYR